MSGITVVTAFFDIGRGAHAAQPRSREQYFEHFSFWAGLKNDLIAFADEGDVERIKAIRERLAPDAKTTVVPARLDEFSPEMSRLIRKTFSEFDQSAFRACPKNIECTSPDYLLLTVLKPFFVCRSISERLISADADQLLWLDFGYNHGGEYFISPEEFDFSLTTQFLPENIRADLEAGKLLIFSVNAAETRESVLSIFCSMKAVFMGGLICGNADAWKFFRDGIFDSVKKLAALGAVDDEQLHMLHLYRRHKEKFSVLPAPHWYESLQYFSSKALSFAYPPPNRKKHIAYKKKMRQAFADKRWGKTAFFGLKFLIYSLLRK